MTCLDIIEYPDERLRQRCKTVTGFDKTLVEFANDLTQTLYSTAGIGLSATQVGCNLRVLVSDTSEQRDSPCLYINPTILKQNSIALVSESCVSIPGVTGTVARYNRIMVRAQDVRGDTFEHELEALDAVCLQHEIDHLDGILITDKFIGWSGVKRGVAKKIRNLKHAIQY